MENIKIEVKLNKQDIGDIQQLANFPIFLADGSQVPLASVATLDFQRNYVRIQRVDGLRTVSVFGDVDASKASSTDIISQFRAEEVSKLQQEYPGLRFDFEGKPKTVQKLARQWQKGSY